jgi:hypothetical protein
VNLRLIMSRVAAMVGLIITPLLPADSGATRSQIRRIVLSSQHLGAHGMGYNSRSLFELSNKLSSADIPNLLLLMNDGKDSRIHVGVQFALASQCQAAIASVRNAAVEDKINFLDAQEIMDLIAGFNGCDSMARDKASAMRTELQSLFHADLIKRGEESERKTAENQRVQSNALKLMDPKQAKTLTREEREEVFHRSIRAAGLDKESLTPSQKLLVERMYRTMVLGESGNASPQ